MNNRIKEPLKELELMEKVLHCMLNPLPKPTYATQLLSLLRSALALLGFDCYGAHFLADGVRMLVKDPADKQEYEIIVKPRKEQSNA